MDLNILAVVFIGLSFIILIGLIVLTTNTKKGKESRYRDKLFNSLVMNSDTAYLLYSELQKELIYISDNTNEILNLEKGVNKKEVIKALDNLFALPILKEELRGWDSKSEFVSSMLSYTAINYQNKKWIKVKVYPYQDKKNKYYIVLIFDASKEHDQQHLLVTQASAIKSREKQLNQITSISYDVEITVNLETEEYHLTNLKEGIRYLGDNKSGLYRTGFTTIFKDKVLDQDQAIVDNTLNFEHLKELADSKSIEPIQLQFRLANTNDLVWLESTIFFTKNRGQNEATILTKEVTEDAEHIRRQNLKLENALKKAEEASIAKNEFMATMSHQIRTPMNTIIGLSEAVLNEELSSKVREDVESINSASTNLLGVIDGILDIDKIGKDTYTLKQKEYNVAIFFKELILFFKKAIQDKKLLLKVNIDPKTPAILYGDSDKLRQVLVNVLSNAIEYTDQGSIIINVKCVKDLMHAKLIVSITDTGIGMTSEEVNSIFENSNTTNGLSICKNMIDVLNGELNIESRYGVGTTVTISTTQKVVDKEIIGDFKSYITKKKKIDIFEAIGKKIMVVDDDKLNLRVAKRLLEPYKVDVTCVSSGMECIELIKGGNNFDLILLDQMMPGVNGTETLHQLQKNDTFTIPVVVLTADAIVGVKEKYLEEGFDDYLSKPIDREKLNQILKKYLK